jgi:hypothetical protein
MILGTIVILSTWLSNCFPSLSDIEKRLSVELGTIFSGVQTPELAHFKLRTFIYMEMNNSICISCTYICTNICYDSY